MRYKLSHILAKELLKHGKITTTLARAKAVRPLVEKLITRAKKGKEPPLRFAARTGGFTRIVKLGPRTGDATEMAIISFVDAPVTKPAVVKKRAYAKQNKTNKSK